VAIEFVSAGTEGSAASGNVAPGAPAGTSANAIWVMVAHGSDQVTMTASSVWTQVYQGNGGGTTSHLAVWWHRYNGTNAPDTTIVHTGGQSPIAGIAAFSGCVTSGSPVDVVGANSSATTASVTVTGVSTATTSTMLVSCFGFADDNNITLTTGTGWVAAFEDSGGGTQGSFHTTAGTPDGGVAAWYRTWDTGAVPSPTFTQAAADPWTAVMFALKPRVDVTNSLSLSTVVTAVATDRVQVGPTLRAGAAGSATVTTELIELVITYLALLRTSFNRFGRQTAHLRR
jgi:hypothetical protein